MAITKEWLDNPFWENSEKTIVRGILVVTNDETATETKEVKTIQKYDGNGNLTEPFQELLKFVTEEKIDENTEKRIEEQEKEAKARESFDAERKKAIALERLFEAKLHAFEIEEIKNSKNRTLKTKLRRSKTETEVNVYATMIMMEELNNGGEK